MPGGEVTDPDTIDVETINVSAAGDITFTNSYDWDDLAINSTAINIPATYGTITMNSTPRSKDLDVDGDININGDIKIDGKSLLETLDALCDRLAVLIPDPDKVEEFVSLKKTYQEYKILEDLVKNGK